MNRKDLANQISDPKSKREFNTALFTRVAKEYDLATRVMSLGGDAIWKAELVQALPPMQSPICVDLATGTGDIAFQLIDRYPDAEVVGIDLTPSMIAVAQKRSSDRRISFQVADMCETGLADECADIVTGSYALRNAPTLHGALKEVWRILKPNGWAAFLDFSKSPNSAFQSLQLGVVSGGLKRV